MNVAPHLFWITSRAAGGAALLRASASVGLGLMMSSKSRSADKRDLRAIHEALSLTTLAMVALHGVALLGDSYLTPGLSGIAIPFAGAYRPLWTGVGIISAYGLAALGLTYYFRNRIGAGSDAAQPWFLAVSGALVVPAALILALRWLGRAEDNYVEGLAESEAVGEMQG